MSTTALAFPIGVVITLIGAAIAYGRMNAKVDAHDTRLTTLEKGADEQRDKVDAKLERISQQVTDLRVLLERVANKGNSHHDAA